jgi:hypothetical protein
VHLVSFTGRHLTDKRLMQAAAVTSIEFVQTTRHTKLLVGTSDGRVVLMNLAPWVKAVNVSASPTASTDNYGDRVVTDTQAETETETETEMVTKYFKLLNVTRDVETAAYNPTDVGVEDSRANKKKERGRRGQQKQAPTDQEASVGETEAEAEAGADAQEQAQVQEVQGEGDVPNGPVGVVKVAAHVIRASTTIVAAFANGMIRTYSSKGVFISAVNTHNSTVTALSLTGTLMGYATPYGIGGIRLKRPLKKPFVYCDTLPHSAKGVTDMVFHPTRPAILYAVTSEGKLLTFHLRGRRALDMCQRRAYSRT